VKIVILGCGRVGSTLATMLDRAGHTVSVIDFSSDAFQRLSPQFNGETIVGNGVDEDILIRAGIKNADAFVAVTNGDNRNIMASQIAKRNLQSKKGHVPHLRPNPRGDVSRTWPGDDKPYKSGSPNVLRCPCWAEVACHRMQDLPLLCLVGSSKRCRGSSGKMTLQEK